MGQIITGHVATNLYWLGRYLERIEATLLEINKAYDSIIDVDFDAGKKLFEKLEIEIDYSDATDFLNKAILGEHPSNLAVLVHYVRENAIISRSYVEFEAFGSIIQLYTLFSEASQNHIKVDYLFIDEALSYISEIWGELTRWQTRNINDYFLKLGKSVEKVEFHLIVVKDKEYAMVIMDEIDRIVSILAPEATFTPHNINQSSDIILDSINGKIKKIILE